MSTKKKATKQTPKTNKPVAKKRGVKFGGRATAGGVRYEVRIAALIATKMLAGDRCAVWNGICGGDIAAITMQAMEPVDDVVVSLRGAPEARVLISAKYRASTIALTEKSSAFIEPVEAFVNQFLKLPATDRATNRLVWAIPSSAGGSATNDLATVLNDHREDAGDVSLAEFIRNRQVKPRKALNSILTEARKTWFSQTGLSPSDEELRRFLRCVFVEVYDFECGHRHEREAEGEIRSHIVTDPKMAKRAWEKLEHFFGRVDQNGVRITAGSLRKILSDEGFALRSPPAYADDIGLLIALTRRNMSKLKDHTALHFGTKLSDSVHIARNAELSALLAAVKSAHLLITGDPGSGKSGLIHGLVDELQNEGYQVVLLLAEEIFARDWKGSANLPGLKHALDDVLANTPDGRPGFLVTDALDAVRDVETQKLLRRLLIDVKDGESRWTVVASVREFDLKFSRDLREAFPGDGVKEFCSNDFSGVSHFHLAGLAETELDELVARRPEISAFVESSRGNPKSAGIHLSPFFLRLAAELISAGVSPTSLAVCNSPAILLRRFWEERVEDIGEFGEREGVLKKICQEMLNCRGMELSTKDLTLVATERTAIQELRSRGVLQSPSLKRGSRVGDESIRFSHHLLHDYAIARTNIPTVPKRFAAFALSEPQLPIFYRQSFMLALDELWDGAGPEGFWSCAIELEGATGLHGIVRNLAPTVAAKRVESLADLQPILIAVAASRNADEPSQKALLHLTSGLQDADLQTVRIGVGAWCDFVVKLASMLSSHPYIEGSLVHIIDRLNHAGVHAEADRLSVSCAARILLAREVAREVSEGWRYATRTSMEAICRTFDAAPGENELALSSLLSTERLNHFPYEDLWDLAHNIQYIKSGGENIVRRLFDAAFSVELKPGEWKTFGSSIMPMRMQTSDNWNSIGYVLAGFYQSITGKDPGLTTELACIAWNACVERRGGKRSRDHTILAAIQFRDTQCELVEDYDFIWGREQGHNENRILSHFESLLRGWASSNDSAKLDQCLDRIAACNRTSSMWVVIMEAGAEYPDSFGALLVDLLNEPTFLTHPNYSHGATALLGALHRAGGSLEREKLEKLIMDIPARAALFDNESRVPIPERLEQDRNRLVGVLEEANIVLTQVRDLWSTLNDSGRFPSNHRHRGMRVISHDFSNSDRSEEYVANLTDPVDQEIFKLCAELKVEVKTIGSGTDHETVERVWHAIQEAEPIVNREWKQRREMAEDLWGNLVKACRNVAQNIPWAVSNSRWDTIRRVLLKGAKDVYPEVTENDEIDDLSGICSGRHATRVDAAEGLIFLVYRLNRADKSVATALRRLSVDKSLSVRFFLVQRLCALESGASSLMWKIIDSIIANERMFTVLERLLSALGDLMTKYPTEVIGRLKLISGRVAQDADEGNHIHVTLTNLYLFHFLRTGDADCDTFITGLIADCDSLRASNSLGSQFHSCGKGGWLTTGDGVTLDPSGDALRARTWTFLLKLLNSAQTKLTYHRERWGELHEHGQPDADIADAVQQDISRSMRLIDDMVMQLYFTSGAFEEKRADNERGLTPVQVRRFWEEARPVLEVVSSELHPHVIYQFVQICYHLLPHSPKEVFLLAARSICAGSAVRFQNESLAVDEVVKLIQRALADHRGIFQENAQSDTECLDALLKVLDLFVEAGWPQARQLTQRLEEIYR
jgi:hypothetical protein